MKAISLWQPWATLMAAGLKKNETRSWSTSYRGPLLIHAAKRKPKKHEIVHFLAAVDICKLDKSILYELPFGAVLCCVELVSCQKITMVNHPDSKSFEFYAGDYRHGRFMWITQNLQTFNPIPFKGSQGFFNVPDELLPDLPL